MGRFLFEAKEDISLFWKDGPKKGEVFLELAPRDTVLLIGQKPLIKDVLKDRRIKLVKKTPSSWFDLEACDEVATGDS